MPIGTYTMLKGAEPSFGEDDMTSAFYYAYGPGNTAVSKYGKISGVITLPERVRLVGTGKGRNAYISLGVTAKNGKRGEVLILASETVELRIINRGKKQRTRVMVGIHIASNWMPIKDTTLMVWPIRTSRCGRSTLPHLLLGRQDSRSFPMPMGATSNSL